MELSNGIGLENSKEHLTPYFCQFLEDTESEVRTAAVRRLSDYGQVLEAKLIIQTIIPSLVKLQTDQFVYVRQALAENLLSICPIIEKGPTNEHVLPIFLALLRDESSDVRLNLFKRLEDLTKSSALKIFSNPLSLHSRISEKIKTGGSSSQWLSNILV